MTFAVTSSAPSSSSGVYTLAQLKQLVADGNEVVMHGQGSSDNANTCSLADFKTMVDGSISFAEQNGFTSDIFVYPQGLQINQGTEVEAKLAYLKEKGVKAAFNVNTGVESSSYEGYEEWYGYQNGVEYKGIANAIPFATMPNGYSKELLLNRANLGRATLSHNWWHNLIHGFIENKAYITFFMHSFSSEWQTVGADNKTTTDLFKEFIEDLIATYGDDIEWRTASQAVAEINNVPLTKAGVENVINNAIDNYIKNNPSSEGNTNTETAPTEDIDFAFLLE